MGHMHSARAALAVRSSIRARMAQHILIVDDDEEIAAELSRVVRAAGFECKVVSDVASALAELSAGPVDVVLLDLGLPGEEGLSPVERVVRAGASARISRTDRTRRSFARHRRASCWRFGLPGEAVEA